MRICTYGDPVLRTACKPVKEITGETCELIQQMFRTLIEADGVGLAACQVGVLEQIVVLRIPGKPEEHFAIINPRIVTEEGTEVLEEGCLSLPDLRLEVARATHVTVEGLDEKGGPIHREASGLLSRAIQHEIDHLRGILIVDRITAARRVVISGRLKELARRTKEEQAITLRRDARKGHAGRGTKRQ